MRIWGKRALHALAMLLVAGLAMSVSLPAAAKGKSKSTQTEAEWIAFDAAAKTVTVKVIKPGKGPNRKMLKKKQEVIFNVIPEGSILKRTSVAINGVKGELGEIPSGKTVFVYWIPDPKDDGAYFARKVDVVLSDEELEARAQIVD